MQLHVSNLGQQITDDSLWAIFAAYGTVSGAAIITEGPNGISKGFAFVLMPDADEATAALKKMNGSIINGKAIAVKEVQPASVRFS